MQDVVIDACCLINLCAAGKILAAGSLPPPTPPRRKRNIDSALPSGARLLLDFRLHVPPKVRAEARYTLKPDEKEPAKLVQAPIDLSPFIQAGLLHPCELTEKEIELFVQMAVALDDGEAECFAIALDRGWLLASDDRPTENLAKAHDVQIITTPELVKHWADHSGVGEAEVVEVVMNIQRFSNYFPRKTLPLHSWWADLAAKAE